MTQTGWLFAWLWCLVIVGLYFYITFYKTKPGSEERFVAAYAGGFGSAVVFWAGFFVIAYLFESPRIGY